MTAVAKSSASSARGRARRSPQRWGSDMAQAVTISSPASAGRASSPASGASATIAARMNSAWMIPAMGVRPPASTLVAVRAIAPVAGSPPNSGEAMFAAPCASSSALERCVLPIIRSATTADSRDSIPASSAMVMAAGARSTSLSAVRFGMDGQGRPWGSSPKRAVTVSTPGSASAARMLARITTSTRPRNCGA